HRLLVGAAFHTFSIPATTLLVDENDPVLGSFVDGLTRTRSEATGIGAVVADSCQVEEPDSMFGKLSGAAELTLAPLSAGGGVLMDIGMAPFGIGGEVSQSRLVALRADMFCCGFEDCLTIENPVWLLLAVDRCRIPDLPVWIGRLQHRQQL